MVIKDGYAADTTAGGEVIYQTNLFGSDEPQKTPPKKEPPRKSETCQLELF